MSIHNLQQAFSAQPEQKMLGESQQCGGIPLYDRNREQKQLMGDVVLLWPL